MKSSVLALLVLFACGDNSEPDDTLAAPILVDTNPDPKVVEVSIVAAVGTIELENGKPAEVWGYRDGSVSGSRISVPGPTLDVNQGDEVIVHFKNEIPESTTIHWHAFVCRTNTTVLITRRRRSRRAQHSITDSQR